MGKCSGVTQKIFIMAKIKQTGNFSLDLDISCDINFVLDNNNNNKNNNHSMTSPMWQIIELIQKMK